LSRRNSRILIVILNNMKHVSELLATSTLAASLAEQAYQVVEAFVTLPATGV
jgi:hypothetical protein